MASQSCVSQLLQHAAGAVCKEEQGARPFDELVNVLLNRTSHGKQGGMLTKSERRDFVTDVSPLEGTVRVKAGSTALPRDGNQWRGSPPSDRRQQNDAKIPAAGADQFSNWWAASGISRRVRLYSKAVRTWLARAQFRQYQISFATLFISCYNICVT